ncbi:hypothetical protein [Actinophytocola xanthii]|uniref:Uncharacterized protein n=1 Tax=Actinophytocola xanthii TaxID=1912961 RepID=A0A1Q8C8Q2_9PSEU|nr:hypothetical protein [Actinophytocola xanthii]OLF10742.1 hypothetical protein BU204_31410 [Actinophytocola xanthii]
MLFFTIRSWRGAVVFSTWLFLILYFGALVLFLTVEPAREYGVPLSVGTGVLVGWLVGADLVSTIKRVEGLPASVRTRVTTFILGGPAAAIMGWANVAYPDGSPVNANVVLLFLLPVALMGLVLFLAAVSLVG